MDRIVFQSNSRPTIGVEVELAIVDAETMALANSIESILARVPDSFASHIKPELMQSYVEINTGVCETVAEAESDLREKLEVLESITDRLGLRLYWSGTHPFSLWGEQKVTPNERYLGLIELLQDMARQLVVFGLHVHVGADSGDKAIMICERMMRHLPTLLALSCNSPWWESRVSGLQSHRAKIMEGLPTAGLPPMMRNWSEYVWLVNHLVHTGFINTIREIWWDVRPHHNFGTVEVRVCDVPGNLRDAMALAALIQCLVKSLSDEIDQGTYQHDCHPMMVRQNKWRACRFGLEAELVDPFTCDVHPVRETVELLIPRLSKVAEELRCASYLNDALQISRGPTWSDRQLDLLRETNDPAEVVRYFTQQSRLSS